MIFRSTWYFVKLFFRIWLILRDNLFSLFYNFHQNARNALFFRKKKLKFHQIFDKEVMDDSKNSYFSIHQIISNTIDNAITLYCTRLPWLSETTRELFRRLEEESSKSSVRYIVNITYIVLIETIVCNSQFDFIVKFFDVVLFENFLYLWWRKLITFDDVDRPQIIGGRCPTIEIVQVFINSTRSKNFRSKNMKCCLKKSYCDDLVGFCIINIW